MKRIYVHPNKWAKVDDNLFESLSAYKWYITDKGYARRNSWSQGKNRGVYMHRQIMGAMPEQIVDHVNRDKLDNQEGNLRFCSHGENRVNSKLNSNNKSGHKNIHKVKGKALWQLLIQRDNKRVRIYRKDLEELISIRDAMGV